MNIFEIEGVDGIGKTTIIDVLKKMEMPPFTYFEQLPNGKFRDILLSKKYPPGIALMLFTADRWDVLSNYTNDDNKNLIFDRYILSTFVYQGIQSQLFNYTKDLHIFNEMPWPKKSVLLTCDPDVLIKRFKSREKKDVYDEIEEIDNRQKRYIKYAEIIRNIYPIKEIDITEKTPEESAKEIFNYFFEG